VVVRDSQIYGSNERRGLLDVSAETSDDNHAPSHPRHGYSPPTPDGSRSPPSSARGPSSTNPAVLCHLYLSAVLPCLTDLLDQDPIAREILGDTQASIIFRIFGGPAVTVVLRPGRVEWENAARPTPSVVLVFLGDRHCNAFFSGKKWALPLLAWGGWRIGVLARFSKLAKRLEAVLDGDPDVLATDAGRRLHARLSLVAAGLGLHSLAEGDAAARQTLRSLPPGLASFGIEGDEKTTVWFDHGSTDYAAGRGKPPRRPDVHIIFANMDTAYGALRNEIDTLAAIGSGHIKVDGLVPLADGLNVVMERLRVYLKP
jgi:hypothetical protein